MIPTNTRGRAIAPLKPIPVVSMLSSFLDESAQPNGRAALSPQKKGIADRRTAAAEHSAEDCGRASASRGESSIDVFSPFSGSPRSAVEANPRHLLYSEFNGVNPFKKPPKTRAKETNIGASRLVDVREGPQRLVSQRTFEGESRVVGERVLKRERRSETRETRREEVSVERVQRQKIVEIIKENPVPFEVYEDKIYDVFVDVPIERTIEREVITELTVERPIEKVVEVPIEQLIEVTVERTVERPVERRREVQRPIERIVQRPYETLRENVVYSESILDVDERDVERFPEAEVLATTVDVQHSWRVHERPVYIENQIVQRVEVPIERVVEVPVEHRREKRVLALTDRPVPVEREVLCEREVPIAREVRRPTDLRVERPIARERIVEMPVERQRTVEREVVVPVERLVEVPRVVERPINRSYEVIVEKPIAVECFTEIPREQFTEKNVNVERVTERPIAKVLHRQIPRSVSREAIKESFVPTVVPHIIDKQISNFTEIPIERVLEHPSYIERISEKPVFVDRPRRVPIERLSERVTTVERLVERPVVIDTIIEAVVEQIVVRDVPVHVEKIIEVPIEVKVERPVFVERLVEEDVLVELLNEQIREDGTAEELYEYEDEALTARLRVQEAELNTEMRENNRLRALYTSLSTEWQSLMSAESGEQQRANATLYAAFMALQQDLNSVVSQAKARQSRSAIVEERVNPRVEGLKIRLRALIAENRELVERVENARKRLPTNFQKKQ